MSLFQLRALAESQHYLNLPFMAVERRLGAVSFVDATVLSAAETPPGGATVLRGSFHQLQNY